MKRTWLNASRLIAIPGLTLALGLILPGPSRPDSSPLRGEQIQSAETATPTVVPTLPIPPFISSPVAGENLQGVVVISGSTAVLGFTSFTIDFAYIDDTTRTWFVIASGGQSSSNGVLGRWDTAQITDGNYRVRLRVFTARGETKRFLVEDVRVRNYTPTDTATPTMLSTALPTLTMTNTSEPTVTRTSVPTMTVTPFRSPTPLPSNPAEVSPGQISLNAARGAAAAVLLFAIFGLFIRLRRN